MCVHIASSLTCSCRDFFPAFRENVEDVTLCFEELREKNMHAIRHSDPAGHDDFRIYLVLVCH